jgi:hybrid signal transduction histidine kinase J
LDIVNKDLEQFNGNSLYNGNNTDTIIKNYDAYITNLIDDIKNGSNNSNSNFNNNNVIDDNGNNTNLSNAGYIIIEFGDEYTLGDKLDYTLHVKPGQ